MPDNSLNGCHVLITCPEHQSHRLCELIEAASGHAYRLPVMEIINPDNIEKATAMVKRLDEFDCAIFISANAVEKSHQIVVAQRSWPTSLKLAAVGKRTAMALEQLGLEVEICPRQGFSSEALLALDALKNIKGKKIVIFRGEGGRELLAQTLRERGALVEYAEVYRRRIPDNAKEELQALIRKNAIEVVVATSNEGLNNLYQIAGEEHRLWLLEKKLVVLSQRTAKVANELGFIHKAKIANQASDEALVESIKAWRNQKHGFGHAHG